MATKNSKLPIIGKPVCYGLLDRHRPRPCKAGRSANENRRQISDYADMAGA
ncbi:MAG: hypothetical protein AB7S77_22675 [Desulfatirhabdiaceae bacterium]